jgi:hypothetical protein
LTIPHINFLPDLQIHHCYSRKWIICPEVGENIIFGPQKIENKYSDPSKFAICVFRNRMKKLRASPGRNTQLFAKLHFAPRFFKIFSIDWCSHGVHNSKSLFWSFQLSRFYYFLNVWCNHTIIVYDLWLSLCISHPTGNKSDIKRERLGPYIYASHMAQVIEKTQTDAYEKIWLNVVSTTTCVPILFRRRPNEKGLQCVKSSLSDFNIRIFCYKVNVGISLSLFNEKDRNTCCCRYHIESNLLFKSCMKFRKSKNQSETSEVESYPVYENKIVKHFTNFRDLFNKC